MSRSKGGDTPNMPRKTRASTRKAASASRKTSVPRGQDSLTLEEMVARLKAISARLKAGMSLAEAIRETADSFEGPGDESGGQKWPPDNVVPIRPGIVIRPPALSQRKTPIQELLAMIDQEQHELCTVLVVAEPKRPPGEKATLDDVRLYYATTGMANPYHLMGLLQSAIMALWTRL